MRRAYKAIQMLIAFVFVLIFLLVLFNNSLKIIGLSIVCLAVIFLLHRLLSKCGGDILLPIFLLLLVAFCFANYSVGNLLKVYPAWDFGRVYGGIGDIIQNGSFATTWEYFLESSNNIFVTLWLTAMVKFAALFGSVNVMQVILLVNSISITCAILFVFLAAKHAVGIRVAFLAGVICFGMAPLYAYSPIVYTDTLSMPFVGLNLLLAVLLLDGKKRSTPRGAFLIVGSGLSAFVGCVLKPTAIFPFIAVLVLEIMLHHNAVKKHCVYLLSFSYV